MNSSRWGLDEQEPVVLPLDDKDPDRSIKLGLDEQVPMEGRLNSSRWRAG